MSANRYKLSFCDDKDVLVLIVVIVAHVCKYTKNQGAIYFRWVTCMNYISVNLI